MVEIIATVESIEQAKQLLPYVDTIFFRRRNFRFAFADIFSREEQSELIRLAQAEGKQAMAAVNGIMHPQKMTLVPEYLAFLKANHVDKISIGDPGIIYRMKRIRNWHCRLYTMERRWSPVLDKSIFGGKKGRLEQF